MGAGRRGQQRTAASCKRKPVSVKDVWRVGVQGVQGMPRHAVAQPPSLRLLPATPTAAGPVPHAVGTVSQAAFRVRRVPTLVWQARSRGTDRSGRSAGDAGGAVAAGSPLRVVQRRHLEHLGGGDALQDELRDAVAALDCAGGVGTGRRGKERAGSVLAGCPCVTRHALLPSN